MCDVKSGRANAVPAVPGMVYPPNDIDLADSKSVKVEILRSRIDGSWRRQLPNVHSYSCRS